MQTGIIFDLKELALFDGPGMRQTVFLKGCPLRCMWCHNPEGLSPKPQMMVGAASSSLCGTIMTSDELVRRIRKNSGYYERYGGGVTFSGGEPIMQAEFLMEVLKQLPDLHRAIETSGYCKPELFQKVVEHLDYIMMDVKIFDCEKHVRYTGAPNDLILENARFLCEQEKPFVIRIPVIPGVNDNEENYRETAEFLAGAKALEKVELLPYHKTAGAKYGMVGMKYEPNFNTEQEVYIPEKLFEEYGIRSEVL